ncbi:hypothetical protein CHUAL_012702 [Chamberlinius hualienensis]
MAGGKRGGGASQSGTKWNVNERSRESFKGTKPLPDPITLKGMSVVLIMHLCRKYLVMDTLRKLAFYAALLVLGSLICDFFPLPAIFFANKRNMLNVYFAKLSWGWTLTLVGVFTALTSNVYCCGERRRVQRHLSRLVVGTAVWFFCTKSFVIIESLTRYCPNGSTTLSQKECISKPGFDISGHAFLLIYCSLVLHEEAKAIRGWDRISDLIRDEAFDEDSVLKILSESELNSLKTLYEKYNHYVKGSFISITALGLLWDFMLVGTILYHHTISQKVAGGFIAIAAWFLTYKVWFTFDMSPGLPGQGLFKYNFEQKVVLEDRRRSIVGLRPALRPFGSRNGTQISEAEHYKLS